jgi:hypothetical protein
MKRLAAAVVFVAFGAFTGVSATHVVLAAPGGISASAVSTRALAFQNKCRDTASSRNRCCDTGASGAKRCCDDSTDGKKRCCRGYRPGKCKDLPTEGRVTVVVPGTAVKLTALATRATAGTAIVVSKVVAPHLIKHAQAFRVVATGRFPAFSLARGRLYALNLASGKWSAIRAVTHSGIYAAVLR